MDVPPTDHLPNPPDLWITTRCLTDDLHLASSPQDARKRQQEHPIVDAFVAQRSQNPAGQEPINLSSTGIWFTLHRGRWRGVTTLQKTIGVVWLPGVGYHRADSRTDAYLHIRTLDQNGELRPTPEDYAALDTWRVLRLAQDLVDVPPRLIDQARRAPGQIVTAWLANRIRVRVSVEGMGDEQILTVAIHRVLEPGPPELPDQWRVFLLAAFFPNRSLDELSYTRDIAGQPLDNEEAYCDFREVI